jgi:DNA-binding response OmpR family regulator
MKILIAEDSFHQRELLQSLLSDWGYDVESASDGNEAWKALQKDDAPALVILDSVMPGMTGPEICQRARTELPGRPRHIILLTVRASTEDIRRGLEAGADDYMAKPFQEVELRARILAGCRAVSLQLTLAHRVRDLERALDRVEQLEGILPICSYCKKIRDDCQDWKPVEEYIAARSEVRFSHGICPGCYQVRIEPLLERMEESEKPKKD